MAKESNLKNMLLTLSFVTLMASALLGGVYALTKTPIDEAMAAKINSAISSVAPEFDNNPSSDYFFEEYAGKEYKVYPAVAAGDTVGYAIESYASGFGGRISLMVGFDMSGVITGTSVLSHAETPGLGDKIDPRKSDFSVQFEGKNPEDFKLLVKSDGGDVDAITASTITSRAFCDAVTTAWEVFRVCTEGQEQEKEQEQIKEVSNE
jgi:electron transport complex protein RnfG